MQLSAIRNEVIVRTGLGVSDPLFDTTTLNLLINASLRRLSFKEDWPWLEATGSVSTVANNRVITLPSYRKVRWLRYQDRNITYTNYRNVPDYYNQTGVPSVYSIESNVVYLLPTPSAVYSIDYGIMKDKEATLVNDADAPLVPDVFMELIFSDVGALVARRKRDRDLEKVYYAEYQNTLRDVLDELIQTTEGFVPRRVGRSGSRG